MDRLTAMRVFAEVATSGSFSATADKLDMSRAMVTRYVADMEQWLQARLLQRTTRSVTLTDAGELALRRCQQMLALTTDLEEETATTAEGELRGQLRLTCSVSFAYAQLGAAIADFLARHPQLKIDLDASEGSLNLVERRIDLAIRISAEPDPMLIGRPLAQCDSVLVASPAYLAAHGTPQQPADLARHRCLSYANFGKSVWQLSRGAMWWSAWACPPLQRQRGHHADARGPGGWRHCAAAHLPGQSQRWALCQHQPADRWTDP
jgi:DNA-binding transcriptional LysR family regulator